MTDIPTEVPDGFEILDRKSPFLDPAGPLFVKKDGRTYVIGVRIAERHSNARGYVHGGLIASLADIALGYSMQLAETPPQGGVTASLTIDFFGAAKIGDWLEVRASAKRVGGSMAFCAADIIAEGAPIGQATGVFKVAR